jgi:hypothetical protein
MRWAWSIMLFAFLFPVAVFAQSPASQDGWTPPRNHRDAQERARRDLSLLEKGHQIQPENRVWYDLQRLRILYFLGLEEEGFVQQVDREAASFRSAHPRRGRDLEATLRAYEAAAEVLRAKHAFWPGAKTGHVRVGLAALDSLVGEHPHHPEVRYLRLVSTAYLPFFFGRGDGAREDARVLAELLPRARGSFPGPTLVAMTDVLLETGRLDGDRSARVRELRGDALTVTPADPLAALGPLPPRPEPSAESSGPLAGDPGPRG